FRFEFLQRLGAAHTHFLLMTLKTLNKPAAAGLDAFAQPLYIAHTIGADVLHSSLGLGGNHEQACRNETCGQKTDAHIPPPMALQCEHRHIGPILSRSHYLSIRPRPSIDHKKLCGSTSTATRMP